MPEISERTQDLLFLGLDHGIASVKDSGGPLTPFVVAEAPTGGRSLTRFQAATLEDSIASAVQFIRTNPPAPEGRLILVYDGYLTVQGERTDAIFSEALESDGAVTILAQRYRPKKVLSKFETVGNAALVPGPGKL